MPNKKSMISRTVEPASNGPSLSDGRARGWLCPVLVIALSLLVGCSAGVKKDDTSLDKRAVERWNYLISHKAEKAYDFLTPGYRATKTRESYAAEMNNRPIRWSSVTFNKKECEEDRCSVYLAVNYSVILNAMMGKPIQALAPLKETWVKTRGKWYYLPPG